MGNKKRVFTVLVIDGGGVRGVVPARVLQEIEDRTGKPICELFDLVGGCSTGAILASGLTLPDPKKPDKPKFTAKDLLKFYHNEAASIFPEMSFKSLRKLSNGALYDPKPLEETLDKHYGNAKMKDSLTHLMIPATDIKNFRPVWIKHIKGQKDASDEGWSSMLVKDAVRASTAAPTYFPAKYLTTTPNEDMPHVTHRHALIDGGFFGGNALRRLYTQAKKLAPDDAEIVLVHVGTGYIENHLSPEEYNKLGPLGLISKAQGSVLISLAMNMASQDIAADMKDEIGDKFISFDGYIDPAKDPASPSPDMDDASASNIVKLEKFAEKIIKENNDDMVRLCGILKHRIVAEERHQQSKEAMQILTEKLAEQKTVKRLMNLYQKILRFSTDLEDKPEKGDEEIQALCKQLRELHKADLDRIYNAILDKKQRENKLINKIKEVGDDITDMFKMDDPPPPPNNDNNDKPPSAGAPDIKRKFNP